MHNTEGRTSDISNRRVRIAFGVLCLLWVSITYFPQDSQASNISTSSTPSGPAGGALAGTYPNPTIATLDQNLLFVEANNRDIGAAAATRPRDIFASRNIAAASTMSASSFSGGNFFAPGFSFSGQYFQDQSQNKGYWDTQVAGFNWLNENRVTTNVNVAIRAVAAQSADLEQWLASGGTTAVAKMGVGGLLSSTGAVSIGTKFTITGCSAGTTVGGSTAGTFVSGTTGACTVVVTMNGATGLTAPTGWHCSASDRTTPANLIDQSASSTTTATLTGTTVSGDVISFSCMGY